MVAAGWLLAVSAVIVKGITSPQDAKEAVARGARGVVVSNYRHDGKGKFDGRKNVRPYG